MLSGIGLRAEWTTSGKEAVLRATFAKENGDDFHVYIIDWLMPDMNGVEVVRRIRKIIGEVIPIIILTAYDWSDIEKEAKEAGVTAFCEKPIFLSELRNILLSASGYEDEEKKKQENQRRIPSKVRHILLVEDVEMVQMKVITGEVDFLRESATIDNISLYRENSEAANINPVMCIQGNTPTDLYLNVNYGLNADGTVKDDDASRAWQEVIQDLRFRQAIAMSIDAEEILDTVYHNLGAVREGTLCTNDVEAANALLDEIGMKDIDGDGYRESPSGLPFSFQIWNAAEASDIVPTTELYVEYLAEIGIRATGYTTESTLLNTSIAANEVPARCVWAAHSIIWHFGGSYSIEVWAPLWSDWYNAGCPEDEEAARTYLIPEKEEDRQLIKNIFGLMTNTLDQVSEVVRPGILNYMDENCYIIRPLEYVNGIVVLNADLRNVPTDVVTHSLNYFLEDLYFAE